MVIFMTQWPIKESISGRKNIRLLRGLFPNFTGIVSILVLIDIFGAWNPWTEWNLISKKQKKNTSYNENQFFFIIEKPEILNACIITIVSLLCFFYILLVSGFYEWSLFCQDRCFKNINYYQRKNGFCANKQNTHCISE